MAKIFAAFTALGLTALAALVIKGAQSVIELYMQLTMGGMPFNG